MHMVPNTPMLFLRDQDWNKSPSQEQRHAYTIGNGRGKDRGMLRLLAMGVQLEKVYPGIRVWGLVMCYLRGPSSIGIGDTLRYR